MAGDDDDKRRVKVAKPDDFDGSDWPTFAQQVAIYLLANKKDFEDDKSKILFVLSYMKEGDALTWATSFTSGALLDPTTFAINLEPDFGKFTDFWDKLNTRFGNPNSKNDAHRDLVAFKQGRKTANEFFLKFEELRRKAGYSDATFDDFCVRLLQANLDKELSTEIIKMEKVPTKFEEWKTRAVALDNHLRAHRERLQQDQARTQKFIPTKKPPPPPPPRKDQSSSDKRDATGVTFGGMGQPMEGISINEARKRGACYRCGRQGHFAKDCPAAKQVIRKLMQDMRPEDRADVAREVALLKEDDFKGVRDEEYVDLSQDHETTDLSLFPDPEQ